MTEHGREAQRDPDEFGGDPQIAWVPSNRSLDTEARELMRAVIDADDSAAFERLMMRTGGRLHQIEQVVLDEVGLCGDLDLVTEWFTTLLFGRLSHVPARPLAECARWMTARAHALINTLAAQPLPWEDGFEPPAPVAWMERLAIETDEPVLMYVVTVTLHRPIDAGKTVSQHRILSRRNGAAASWRDSAPNRRDLAGW